MTTDRNFLYQFAFRLFAILLIGCTFASCKTGNTIADHGVIQKRKYQKGYHVNVKTPFKLKKDHVNQADMDDRPFMASVKAEMSIQHEKAELQYPNRTSSKLILESEMPLSKLDVVQEESGFDENMEASTAIFSALKSQSVFPGFGPASNTIKQASSHSKDPDYYTDYAAVKRTNTLALLSFIFAMASLFIFGLPFGVAAVVCGIIGITQIEKKPTVYKGKAFAIIGIVVGIVAVLVMLVYFSSL